MAHRPKKIDPIDAALLDAAEDAEAGVEVGAGIATHGYSTELRDWKRRDDKRESRRASVPTFDNPDVIRPQRA